MGKELKIVANKRGKTGSSDGRRLRVLRLGEAQPGGDQEEGEAEGECFFHGFTFFWRTATVRFSSVRNFLAASKMSLGVTFSIVSM